MPLYIKGTDIEIIGVLEEVRGNAAAFSLCDDGSIEYAGGTTFFYNEQKMVLASNGQPIWLDEDGAEYPGAEVEDRREDGTVVSWHRLEQDIEDDLYDALDDLAKMKVRLERVRARNDKFRSFQAHVALMNLSVVHEAIEQSLDATANPVKE